MDSLRAPKARIVGPKHENPAPPRPHKNLSTRKASADSVLGAMKQCVECDIELPDDTFFCPECGQALTESSTTNGTGASELVGRTFFGEYTITDHLGEGGMGAVYLAKQDTIDQRIALKVLHPEAAESDEIIQRFHREARVISMLSHPNIVRVFIFGRTEDDLLFLVMEYVDGVELREKLDGTPMDELVAIKIMKQVCSAVAEAHDLGIIHRDLKPENILLTEFRGDDNFAKILDFGIAKIKYPEGQQGPQLTKAGIVYGTPEYLSPEQAQAHDLDPRTDIYALGCMLFEMLTGRMPFQADSSVEILKQKVFEDPPLAANHGDIAPTMNEIIATAMAQDRENRFDDALEMFEALDYREEEIRSERQISTRETWFPGRELTGVHQTVETDGAEDDHQQDGAQKVARTLPRPGEGARESTSRESSGQPQRPDPASNQQSGRGREIPETRAQAPPQQHDGSQPSTQIMDPPPGAPGSDELSGQQRSVKHHLLLGGAIGVSIIVACLVAYFGYVTLM